MRRVVIALGSNLADPRRAVSLAWGCVVQRLGLANQTRSSLHVTAPAEAAGGPRFINAVGIGNTSLPARRVLAELHHIEAAFGRERTAEGFHGARPLDLDLIDFDGQTFRDERLTIPHPRLESRVFVLAPLAELLPEWRHPTSQATATELLKALRAKTPPEIRLRTGLGFSTLLTVFAACVCCACSHPPAPPSPWSAVSAPTPAPPLAMRVATITDSKLLNDFYDALAAYEGGKFCAESMLTAAARLSDDALKVDQGARLLAVHAVYRIVQNRALGSHFPTIRKLVDRLHRASAKSPETRFALAYLRWILVHTGDGQVRANDLDQAVIADLHRNLAALVHEHPKFDGPGEFDRQRIVAAERSVAGLLKDVKPPPDPS